MKLKVQIVALLVVAVFFTGCASNRMYLPERYALKQNEEAVSLPDGVEFERAGVKNITVFKAQMPNLFLTELVMGGGVWPLVGQGEDGKGRKGYCYLSDIDHWGKFILECVVIGKKDDVNNSKYVILNRDGGFAFKLNGSEASATGYDPKEFEDEKGRQTFLASHGTTLWQNDQDWTAYAQSKGADVGQGFSTTSEIKVLSPEWESYQAKLRTIYPYVYTMPDGSIKVSHMPPEVFRRFSSEIKAYTFSGRALKYARIPIVGVGIASGFMGPAGLAVMLGMNVANTAASAAINNDWTSNTARSKVMRSEMAPEIANICNIYQQMLAERDKKIIELQRQGR